MTALELREVGKRFGSAVALEGVSLEVAAGEFVVLVGPSGCGKSTLLRIVAGLEVPSAGRVFLDGRDVTELEPSARDVAMVFQSYALYPHMTVRANLAFPLRMARRPRAEVAARVARVAEALELGPLLERKPGTLSGGQMQRVALGRAIVRDPALFLFDEPLSNLDAKLRAETRAEIVALHRRLGTTSLYVTHDQAEAMTMGARICVLSHGRVQQIGAPLEVYRRPANTFVASFLGSPPMNLLSGQTARGRFRLAGLDLAAPEGRTGGVVLGVRPEDLELGGPLEVAVEHAEPLGAQTHLRAELGGQPLWITCGGGERARPGDRLRLTLPAERLHWFDSATGRRLEG